MEIFSKSQVLASLKKAPHPIQKVFGDADTTDAILRMRSRYNLHVDVAAILSREIGYLLLGLIDPESFLKRIQEAGVNEETAKSITEDTNREIFVPLQRKMREPEQASPEETDEEDDGWGSELQNDESPSSVASRQPIQPNVPVMQVGTTNILSSQENFPTERVLAQTVPQQAPVYNLIRPETAPPQTPAASTMTAPASPLPAQETVAMPSPRTMASDVNALTHPDAMASRPESVVATHFEQGSRPIVPHPWQTSPAQSFQTASVPYTSMPVNSRAVPAPPPVQLPGAWATNSEVPGELPVFKSSSTVAPLPERPEPLTKEYGSDPYREPIS